MAAIQVSEDAFAEEVLEAKKPVLVDFWASWCGPCQTMSPIVEEIADERDDIKVCQVNVDDNEELAIEYQVYSIPTFIVFQDGKQVNQVVGAVPKDQLLAMLP